MTKIDNIDTKIHVVKKNSVALIVSTFQPNKESSKLLRIAIDSIQKFKPDNADIWVVDVGSPESDFIVRPKEYPDVNFIVTSYTPRSWVNISWKKKLLTKLLFKETPRQGSHANAWTLDFAIKSFKDIQYTPDYFMTLQMDVMFTNEKVIQNLLSMFDEKTAAVGVLKQKNLAGTHDILHSLGCMWNYKIYNNLNLTMEIDFPNFDVGELAITKAVNKGYHIKNFNCSFSNPEIVKDLPERYQNLPGVDRSINTDSDVVFMHLGRGIPKTENTYWKTGRTSFTEWESWFDRYIK
jgi:hypothetical protein